jgi:hypothetical protein
VLDDASVLDAEGVEDVGAHRAAGRRVAHERAVVGAGACHPQPDDVAGDGEVLDREVEVGERAPQ